MKEVQILINGRFLGRPATGVDRVAFELTRALIELGSDGATELSVVVPPSLESMAKQRLGEKVEIVVLGKRRVLGHLWEQAYLARAMPDAWLVGCCNTGPIVRRKQAVVFHDAQIRTHPESYSRLFRVWYSGLYPVLSRRAKLAFTVSRYSRQELEETRLVPRSKLGVLYNGVDHIDNIASDPGALAHFGLRPNRYFLAVGSPAPHKNLATLQAAFAASELVDCDLVLAGSILPHVFGKQSLAGQANIRQVGRVSDAQLKALYQSATALCIPSLTEGFGLSALEAMRCGTPVIASAAGALPEVCGDAAVLLPPTDVEAWRAELQRLAGDERVRQDLIAAGRVRSEGFIWSRSAESLREALIEAERQYHCARDAAAQA